MKRYNLTYSVFNERSILIEWPPEICKNILKDRLNFEKAIKSNYNKVILDIISSYNSLLIIYKFTIDNFYGVKNVLNQLYETQNDDINQNPRLWKIPVCYNRKFAIDLHAFSEDKNLSISTIIERHSSVIYTVFFRGFLPGFLYLGGLDKSLHLDRKPIPNLNIQKGSVAIGGNQTGIYPQNSPGGWHVIGRTPVSFFDVEANPICFANDGDKIQFQHVTLSEYIEIESAIENGNYQLESEVYHD